MKQWIASWLRPPILAGVEAELARLRRDLDGQKAAVADLESLTQLAAARTAASDRSPEEWTAALRPVLEEMLRQQAQAQSRRRWRGAVAAIAITAASTGAVGWWRSGLPLFSPAAARAARPLDGGARVAPPAALREAPPAIPPVTLEERRDGFGLGQSARSDRDLAGAVRERLGRCPELAGAELQFSVREGWIWLRGAASESGRRAAERALLDLGDGVLVVNQIEAAPAALVAER